MTRNSLRSVCLSILWCLVLGLIAMPRASADPAIVTLFVSPTGSGADCGQAAPCDLQAALTKAADGDAIYVAQGAYTGTGAAVVTLTKSIALYGGWNGAPAGNVVRDPAAYPTTLDGEQARRVVHVSGNISPTLDGFTVTGGNASGAADCDIASATGCGGGIYVRQAHPIIANNLITGNVAATSSSADPQAIAYGGGIFLSGANRAFVASNVIISNAGSTGGRASGGGITLWGSGSGLEVRENQVVSNSATTTEEYSDGGGIYGAPTGAVIRGNLIQGNRNNVPGSGGRGAGVSMYGGAAHYDGNVLRGNAGAAAAWLAYCSGQFTRNLIVDNATIVGVKLEEGSGCVLANNVVARSGIVGISAEGFSAASLLTASVIQNTLSGAGSGTGLSASFASLVVTNTLVSGWALGIANTTAGDVVLSPDHTLFFGNAGNGIQGTGWLTGDPAFLDAAGGDFHIGLVSAAKNAGAPTWVSEDIDGQPRLGLPDIGADQWWGSVCLPLVTRNP